VSQAKTLALGLSHKPLKEKNAVKLRN